MKYYIYISDTKVDMLYPQIPKSLPKKIASSLNIDLKLLGVEVSVSGKSNPSDETRYTKVKIVSEYIEKHIDVGTIDAPSTYLKGTLSMGWGLASSGLVYFGGHSSHTVLGLGGSMHHVIGNDQESLKTNSFSSLYRLKEFLGPRVLGYGNLFAFRDSEHEILFSVADLNENMKNPKQELEFLAKTLLQGSLPDDPYIRNQFKNLPSYVVLGTPIYVAIND